MILIPPRHPRDRQSGQAVAEFALVLPVLVLFVMGMVDLARVFYTYQALVNAAREGARYCALNPGDNAGTRTRVQGELDGRITLTSAQVTAITCPNPGAGNPLTVTVSATFTPITPLIDKFFRDSSTGSLRPVRASATMQATS